MKRFSPSSPCPICGGHPRETRGRGVRCYGFLSEEREFAHCTREEYAGNLPLVSNSNTYAHKLTGECRCGARHGNHIPLSASLNRKRKIVTYDYKTADGTISFQVVRHEPKGFLQRRPDGTGGWIYDLKGTPRLLYRLPELIEARGDQTVYVVEGEKDADNLSKRGL